MRAVVALLGFVWALNWSPAHAQAAPGLATNGCGAKGWSNFVVPNSALAGYCQFKSACDKHDLCYSRCLLGGELHGSPLCADQAQRTLRRAACDVRLHEDIVKENAGRVGCTTFARVYRWAVEQFGEGAFKGFSSDTAKMDAIGRFVDYMVTNPGVFDAQAVEKVFASASADSLDVLSIEFIPGIPRLRIRSAGPLGIEVLELKGTPVLGTK